MYEDIKQFLGNEVIKLPLSMIENSLIPEESKNFLTSVGLPTRADLLFPIFKRAQDFSVWSYEGRSYLILAEERGQKLCLDLETGSVLVVDSRGELPKRFVNSDVKSLVVFLKYYSEAKDLFDKHPKETANEILSRLRRAFTQEDAAALEDDESWWSVILEQIEQGLM